LGGGIGVVVVIVVRMERGKSFSFLGGGVGVGIVRRMEGRRRIELNFDPILNLERWGGEWRG
jgi:hypothetical protein